MGSEFIIKMNSEDLLVAIILCNVIFIYHQTLTFLPFYSQYSYLSVDQYQFMKSQSKKALLQTPSSDCSPSEGKVMSKKLSFANLRNIDRTQQKCHRTPIQQRNKNEPNITGAYTKNKSSKRQPITTRNYSIHGQMNRNLELIEQNQGLKHRISILEQQQWILEQNCQLIKDENQKIKEKCMRKQQQFKKKGAKIREYRKKSEQYDQVVAKLDQLQKIQDCVIQDNDRAKTNAQNYTKVFQRILQILNEEEQISVFNQYIDSQETNWKHALSRVNQLASQALIQE